LLRRARWEVRVSSGSWVSRLLAVILTVLLVPPPAAWAVTDGSTIGSARGAIGLTSPGPGVQASHQVLPDGSASFRFPIPVPPATGGMQPDIELSYRSSLRQSSWVGYGWELSLGAIHRSLGEGVPTYDDTIDQFVLEGQKLVPDGGGSARYHPRRETFQKIERVSWDRAQTPPWSPDPAGDTWEVRERDGTICRYGIDSGAADKPHPDSATNFRIENASGQTYAWLLTEIEDVDGNIACITYDDSDPGLRYPQEVRYTLRRSGVSVTSLNGAAPPQSSVDRVVTFTLEARPDVRARHSAGLEQRLTQRLGGIDVVLEGVAIRSYDLLYEASSDSGRSLLTEIRDLGNPSAGALPRTTRFSYRASDPSIRGWALDPGWTFPSTGPGWIGVFFVSSDSKEGGARLVDVDGDGRLDLARQIGGSLGRSSEAEKAQVIVPAEEEGASPAAILTT